mgnify:CR=1 FL=1|tara:strand:+ start:10631 stop:10900 length:270 start_codon:yes stop_codon:yes gene_type:complete
MISRWLQEKGKRSSFKEVFSGEEGQDVLAMLSNAHFVFQTSHANDPYTSAWQEGRRTVVMEIINLVGADLEAIRKRIDLQEQARVQNRA